MFILADPMLQCATSTTLLYFGHGKMRCFRVVEKKEEVRHSNCDGFVEIAVLRNMLFIDRRRRGTSIGIKIVIFN